ncbi:MAG: hypothetical protein ACP5N2_02110 [Candidatus Nanoarchaeia archaeon]
MNNEQYRNATLVAVGGALIFGAFSIKSIVEKPRDIENEIVKEYIQTESLISYLENLANYKFVIRATKDQNFGNDMIYYVSTQELVARNIIKKTNAYHNLSKVNNQIDSLSNIVQKEIEQMLKEETVPKYKELCKTHEVQEYNAKNKKNTANLVIGFFGFAACYAIAMLSLYRASSLKPISKEVSASPSSQHFEDETGK